MAPPPSTPKSAAVVVHATYTSPTELQLQRQHTFTYPLTISARTDSKTAKTAYLSELRAAVGTLQHQINVFLTARMEEDRLRDGDLEGGGERERREEENYGEEVVDDEDG
jgi:hypothetical protein